NYLDLSNTTSSPFDWNAPLSYSFWVRPLQDAPSTGNYIIFKGNGGLTAIKGITYGMNCTPGNWEVYANRPGNHCIINQPYAFTSSTWYYVVMTKDANNVYALYVNNNFIGSSTDPTVWTPDNDDVTIGSQQGAGSTRYSINADFDEFAVFSRALTES